MSLKSQIIKLAQQTAIATVQNFQATAQIAQQGQQTNYLGQILSYQNGQYTVGFPDGTTQNVAPGGYSSPSVGDTVVVIGGVIVA